MLYKCFVTCKRNAFEMQVLRFSMFHVLILQCIDIYSVNGIGSLWSCIYYVNCMFHIMHLGMK